MSCGHHQPPRPGPPSHAHLESALPAWLRLLWHRCLLLLLAVRLKEEVFPRMQHCRGGTGCHGTAGATARGVTAQPVPHRWHGTGR